MKEKEEGVGRAGKGVEGAGGGEETIMNGAMKGHHLFVCLFPGTPDKASPLGLKYIHYCSSKHFGL